MKYHIEIEYEELPNMTSHLIKVDGVERELPVRLKKLPTIKASGGHGGSGSGSSGGGGGEVYWRYKPRLENPY